MALFRQDLIIALLLHLFGANIILACRDDNNHIFIDDYKILTVSSCSDGLVDNMDHVIFHSQIRSMGTSDIVQYSLWDNNTSEHLCFVKILHDCNSPVLTYCSCDETEDKGVYNITIKFVAIANYSEDFFVGELLRNKQTMKDKKKMPKIYDITKDTTTLYINGKLMKPSHCNMKIKGNDVSLVYSCHGDSPLPCWLEITDDEVNQTLKSGYKIISLDRKLQSNKNLTFRNELCGLKNHAKTFHCSIIIEVGITLNVYVRRSATGCDDLLVGGQDPVVMSSVIVTNGSDMCANGIVKFTKAMRNSIRFSEIYSLNISADCREFSPIKECSCKYSAGVIQANVSWTAGPSDSGAAVRAELLCTHHYFTSEVRRLPRIFGQLNDAIQLYINEDEMNTTDCKVKGDNDQVIVAFRCRQIASPCWLDVWDNSRKTKIKSGSNFLSFLLNLNESVNLTFTYQLCMQKKSKPYNFTCALTKYDDHNYKAATPLSDPCERVDSSYLNIMCLIFFLLSVLLFIVAVCFSNYSMHGVPRS